MNKSLVIVDEFLPNAEEFRRYALSRDYLSRGWRGAIYHGIGLCYRDLTSSVSEAFGSGVEIDLQFFRLTDEKHQPTTYIHPDSACSKYAGVLYLSDPVPGCGTAFWTNKQYDIDRMPEGASPKLAEHLEALGEDEKNWDLNTLAGMQFNRFIFYPSNLFHSRYPKQTWGTTKENSRLIWACFFRSK